MTGTPFTFVQNNFIKSAQKQKGNKGIKGVMSLV
jgi:hypothetical protein